MFTPKKAFPAPAPDASVSAALLAPEFTLRQISYFVAAAQHGSVQRAAHSLHVSAPAVSAAIAHVEATLGVRLFHRRHARGLVLTDAGSALALECRNLLNQAWELGSGRRLDTREVQGWVHLGCLFSFAPFVIPPLVRAFQERYPAARVYWHEAHHGALMEGLQSGAYELAILYDFEVPSGIDCIPIRPAPLQAVLPGGHMLARRRRIALGELAAEPLVLLDLPRTAEYILSAFGTSSVTPRIGYRVQSIPMLRGLVASGLGYGLLNFCPPFTHPAMGTLVSRPLDCALRSPSIVVARSHRYRMTRAARALVDCTERIVRGRARRAAARPVTSRRG